MRWLHRGACRNKNPELFFPIGTTGPALRQIEAAKQVCGQCQVVEVCLDWALSTGQDAGVWGGLSEIERRELKRRTRGLQTAKSWSGAELRNRDLDDAPGTSEHGCGE